MNERIEVSEVQRVGDITVVVSVAVQYEDFNADEAMKRLFAICDKLNVTGQGRAAPEFDTPRFCGE